MVGCVNETVNPVNLKSAYMKKLLSVCSVILFFSLFANAQHTSFGVKAGINASSVNVEDGTDYNNKVGIHLGGLAHIHITQHFAFQPELVYSMQGGKDGDNYKLKLNYLNIPLLAQYMTHDGFRLQTGPQIGFLTSAKSKSGDVEVDIKDQLESVDFSWVFGAGYLFPGAGGIGVDARYNLGLSNISDDNDFEAKNRVFQIGVFYQFNKAQQTRRKR
jgi:hypothetical protein